MLKINSLTDGEVLLLVTRRSGKSNTEIAQLLDIHPNHLSKLFKSEKLAAKVKNKALRVFGEFAEVRDSDGESQAPLAAQTIAEERTEYLMSADLGKIIKAHQEERAQLLGIIETLSKQLNN